MLTISATGSEMNSGAVISRYETKEKYPFSGDYPLFSILDPGVLYSLPKRQIACGLADTFVHVLEQYLTAPGQSRLMDRWAEGILHTVSEIAPEALSDNPDYDVMSEYMLSATLALNDMIRMGVREDWATHMIGHEITALHGLTHGATLAIVINGTLRVLREQKRGKLLQYGRAYLGHCRGHGGGAHRPYDRGQRGVFPFAGAFDAAFGGGHRRGDRCRDRTALQRRGLEIRRGGECRWRYGPADSRSLPLTALYRIRKSPRPFRLRGFLSAGRIIRNLSSEIRCCKRFLWYALPEFGTFPDRNWCRRI